MFSCLVFEDDDRLFCEMVDRQKCVKPYFKFWPQWTKFSLKGFFKKCDQIRSFPAGFVCDKNKSLSENFIFCVVVGSEPAETELKTLLVHIISKINWLIRGVFRTLSNIKIERFPKIVNGWSPFTIYPKGSIVEFFTGF